LIRVKPQAERTSHEAAVNAAKRVAAEQRTPRRDGGNPIWRRERRMPIGACRRPRGGV